MNKILPSDALAALAQKLNEQADEIQRLRDEVIEWVSDYISAKGHADKDGLIHTCCLSGVRAAMERGEELGIFEITDRGVGRNAWGRFIPTQGNSGTTTHGAQTDD